ncbi:XRE family transcriptional regulator, partial [Enterococcus casseliflavus]
MLKNRLAVLLAERELTAAKVYEETGISRSTLSSLVNNSGDGVQYKTLDRLCNFLEIEPNDFFDYAPYIFEYELESYGEEKSSDIFSPKKEYFLNIKITQGLKKTMESMEFFFFNDSDKLPFERIEEANLYATLEILILIMILKKEFTDKLPFERIEEANLYATLEILILIMILKKEF